jgi:hypothetical protein
VPRLAGGVLCAIASILLLLSSVYMSAGNAEGGGAALILLVGLGLLLAALQSLGRSRLG